MIASAAHIQGEALDEGIGLCARPGPLIGTSPAMRRVYGLIELLGETDVTVLLQGRTGAGKGLVARTLHRRSRRAGGPFLRQNCGALPRELLESELFGHCRGSFTGAYADREGLFEAAEGGTVFLDEIGEAPAEAQVRLLHVLEEGEVKRVGENRSRPVDVRVIAATNRDLEAEVSAGRFREDLYYRLRVFPICLPPLRERVEDIPLLARHFLRVHAGEKEIEGFDPEVLRAFRRYNWPGNIRELENEVRRCVVLVREGGRITVEHVSERIARLADVDRALCGMGPLKAAVEQFEEDLIRAALNRCGWNVTHTAAGLGLSRVGLQGKLRKYGIQREVS